MSPQKFVKYYLPFFVKYYLPFLLIILSGLLGVYLLFSAVGASGSSQLYDPYARRIVPVSSPPATCNDNEVVFVIGSGAYQCVDATWQPFTSIGNDLSVVRTVAGLTKTTDTNLANIPDLTFPLDGAKTYPFKANLFVDSSALGGAKFAIQCTCSATSVIYHIGGFNSGGLGVILGSRQVTLGGSAGFITTTTSEIEISGVITTSTPGNLTVQFAQQVSSGSSSVLPGSYFQRF